MTLQPLPSEIRKSWDFELRDLSAQGRFIEARAIRHEVPNDTGAFIETFTRGVFAGTLSRHSENIPMVMGHDDSQPAVARSVEWRETKDDLVGVFKFQTHAEALRAIDLAEQRAITQVSVAFLPSKKPGGSEWTLVDGVPHVRRNAARLIHLGMVTAPADIEAEILCVRSLGVPEDLVLKTPRLDEARELLERIRAGRLA